MLVIKRITLVSAFVAAPLALWGCSSKNESPQTNPDSGGGDDKDTDKNGADPDASAAEKAIRGIIGDELYANYNNTEKSRDKDLITRVYNAVIAATKDELGEDAALNALKTWKEGEEVPAAILTYIEKILDGTYPINPPTTNWPTNNIPNPWTPECAKQVADLRKAPATAAIKEAIGKAIESTDQDKIDATFKAVAGYLVDGYTDADGKNVAGLGKAAVNNALSTWKVGDDIPQIVVAALTAYVANQNEEH